MTKKSGSAPLSDGSSVANVNSSSQPVENGTQAAMMDWGAPSAPAPAWGAGDGAGSLDWSQPLVQIEDDGLQLDWGKEKDEDEDDDDDEDGGLTMKKPEAETKAEPISQTLKEESQVWRSICRKTFPTLMLVIYDQCLCILHYSSVEKYCIIYIYIYCMFIVFCI